MTNESDANQFQGVFNEVRPIRGFEDIAAQIQQAIYSGQLKSGDKLPNERELVSLFGVSRPTLREAIRLLEAEGIVEVRRGVNGGTYVAEPKPDQVGRALETLIRFRGVTVGELAEFRENFESETAYLAAERATPEQIDRLLEIAERVTALANDPATPWPRLVDLDIAFHEEVAYASQNQIRVAIMLSIHGLLHKASLFVGKIDSLSWRLQQAADLTAIARAISHRQPRSARKAMKVHVLRNVESEILRQMRMVRIGEDEF